MNYPPHSTKMTRAQIICLPFTSFVGLHGQEPTFMAEQRNNWTLVRTAETFPVVCLLQLEIRGV
jgi:hypothetical protein